MDSGILQHPVYFYNIPQTKPKPRQTNAVICRGFGFALYIVFVVGLFEDMFEL